MVERVNSALPISQQCRLLALPRSSVYRKPTEVSAEDLAIMALIDRHYLARPYYGSRRMTAWLATQGHHVNRKRVQRLMRLLGLAAIYQRPNTSKPVAAHKIYPYLLRGLVIDRVNQVWCSDIYLHPDGQRLSLPGGDHGLGEPRGASPTRSTPIFASRRSRRRSRAMANRKSSIPTKAASSPVTILPPP